MSRVGFCFVLTTGLVCGWSATAFSQAAAGAARERRVLYLTHSEGFKHGVLELSEKLLKEMGEKSGAFKATCLEGHKQAKEKIDLSMITPEYLAPFDAIIFYTTGHLPLKPEQQKAIIDFVKEGKGFVGIHSATDYSSKEGYWPEFVEMIGPRFKTHGANNAPLVLKIHDPKHPATKMLPQEWKIADEMYQFITPVPRDKFRILITVDTEKSEAENLKKNKMEKGQTYEVAWCRKFGKGRVFYTSLGHNEEVWKDKLYQQHLIAGIQWAMGDLKGSAMPSDAKPPAGKKKAKEGAEKKE